MSKKRQALKREQQREILSTLKDIRNALIKEPIKSTLPETPLDNKPELQSNLDTPKSDIKTL